MRACWQREWCSKGSLFTPAVSISMHWLISGQDFQYQVLRAASMLSKRSGKERQQHCYSRPEFHASTGIKQRGLTLFEPTVTASKINHQSTFDYPLPHSCRENLVILRNCMGKKSKNQTQHHNSCKHTTELYSQGALAADRTRNSVLENGSPFPCVVGPSTAPTNSPFQQTVR